MKKLIGIEKDFSLFENKEMKNLQSIVGGYAATQKSIESNASGAGTADADKYSDTGKYLYRVIVGPILSSSNL
jgi:putative peptide modification target (TIGR04139 family)